MALHLFKTSHFLSIHIIAHFFIAKSKQQNKYRFFKTNVQSSPEEFIKQIREK
jgi:hypothetical protein